MCWGVGGQTRSPWPLPSSISQPDPLADYQTLRIGGLVFAVVLFSVGILLILSESVPLFSKGPVCSCEAGGVRAWPRSVLETEGAWLSC